MTKVLTGVLDFNSVPQVSVLHELKNGCKITIATTIHGSGSITSVGEERANLFAVVYL